MNRLARLVAGGIAVAALATTAHAQGGGWTVVNLHPAGATESYASGVSGGQQVGSAFIGSNLPHASLWSGSAASWVDLHPVGGWTQSYANGISGGQQVGTVLWGGTSSASLWSGSAASFVSLNPWGASSSVGYGISGGTQVGGASFPFIKGTYAQAGLWSGSSASWLGFNPISSNAVARGVFEGQQVGYVDGCDPKSGFCGGTYAFLWGSAILEVLHPAGALYSAALGVSGGQQVGYAEVGTPGFSTIRASLWTGSAASLVDLHPAGSTESWAAGVHAGQQVGFALMGGFYRASLWTGTAASWVNLHAYLPPAFTNSYANGIWHDGAVTYVVGNGYNSTTQRYEALMWVHGPPSCYPDCNANGSLTVADFGCFQTKFVLADPYADCNGQGGLTVADFGCFQTKFVAGCP